MKNRFWILVAVLALLSPAAMAGELPYSFVQGSWASVDPDVGDSGTGPALDLSWGLTGNMHLVGSYEDVDFDVADATTMQVGAGYHRSLPMFDLVGEATWVDAEVNSVSDNGFAVCGTARKQFSESWEVSGGVEHIDVGVYDDTLFAVNALYNLKDRFALGAGYKVGDANTMHFGFRFNFSR